MLDMGIFGWIIVGFIAGALSGLFIGDRTARGCLPTMVVGVLGGIVGGWIAQQLGTDRTYGFVAAVAVAFVGSLVVRLILRALEGGDRRRW